VLCVGGLTGARNHYRAEIEIRAGRFLHHDGGREDNLHRLTPMLAAADIVICASGNISHNAYHLVKSTCKKLGKPCVLVKGTGIASFLDGLGHLAADDAPADGPRRAATASCAASASGARRAKSLLFGKIPNPPTIDSRPALPGRTDNMPRRQFPGVRLKIAFRLTACAALRAGADAGRARPPHPLRRPRRSPVSASRSATPCCA
jgi:hypothetical protein